MSETAYKYCDVHKHNYLTFCRFCAQRGPREDHPSAGGDMSDAHDTVNHPAHYTGHPSGVECIAITEHMGFCVGNAVKYLWRAGHKGPALDDLRKARWYIDREIARVEAQQKQAGGEAGTVGRGEE